MPRAGSSPQKTRRISRRLQTRNMEILFLGVILVGFMVFISTKIKKSAATAFEREIIEKQDFTLIKPEGFISPVDENSEFVFEAYTKEFGKNDADEFRQASANLSVKADLNLKTAIENIKNSGEKILSENAVEAQKICLFETEKIEKNITVKNFYKVVESTRPQKIYQLRISVLDVYLEEYKNKVNEMLESFVLK